jgi:hypothetical protein
MVSELKKKTSTLVEVVGIETYLIWVSSDRFDKRNIVPIRNYIIAQGLQE